MKILDSSKLFFTADTHYGHKNIIRFSERQFTNIETMDDALIRNWNSTVPQDGIVFHIGDFSFHNAQHSKWILEQLNGRVILIKGNHDKCTTYFKEVHEIFKIKVADEDGTFGGYNQIILSHFPFAIWDKKHYGSWHLHGHSHGTYKPVTNNKILDVGVDCWDYKPVSYKQIKEKLC